jgi:hypothetical protein
MRWIFEKLASPPRKFLVLALAFAAALFAQQNSAAGAIHGEGSFYSSLAVNSKLCSEVGSTIRIGHCARSKQQQR